MRIASLLPAATEIVYALGRGEDLIGVTDECDYPPDVSQLPALTEPKFKVEGTSAEIDQRVRAIVRDGLSAPDWKVNATKWTYNMINGGADAGSWISDAYNVMLTSGAATLADLPYDSNYTAWVYKPTASYHGNTKTAEQVWRQAIANRMDQSGTVGGLDTDTGLSQLKTLLTDGYILNYATDIYGWQFKAMGDDPSTSDDDGYAGKQGCYAAVVSSSGHAMTIVGYDDSIWMDINSNGLVDSGEKGALKIANSWGSGWQSGGFSWVSYDALKAVSAVSGWTPSNRQAVFWSDTAYWITARPAPYVPTLLAEFTAQPLAALLNTDVEQAIQAAMQQGILEGPIPPT
jgi:hypothetical protein